MTVTDFPAPSFGEVFRGGLPSFLREGFLPLAAFYVGQRLGGLHTGVAAATAVALLEYALARRAGREGLLVRVTLAFVLVQGAIGVMTESVTAYLATPLIPVTVWGVLFLGSTATRRPLAGVLASSWYPFPPAYRRTDQFVDVFRVVSAVWGTVFVARAAVRLAFLWRDVETGHFVVVSFLTGAPVTLAAIAWSIRYAITRLPEPPEPTTGARVRPTDGAVGDET